MTSSQLISQVSYLSIYLCTVINTIRTKQEMREMMKERRTKRDLSIEKIGRTKESKMREKETRESEKDVLLEKRRRECEGTRRYVFKNKDKNS